ncbi:MAG: hypothetical protein ACI88G_001867, partial [Woeseiaceae bacterium]
MRLPLQIGPCATIPWPIRQKIRRWLRYDSANHKKLANYLQGEIMKRLSTSVAFVYLLAALPAVSQDEPIDIEGPPPVLTGLKAEAAESVGDKQKLTQEIVDSLFSFSELGFQEFETQRYLTGILEQNGFTIERGVSGIPSAWWATWGSGKPVIALGSDVDGIPKSSQMPGVAY